MIIIKQKVLFEVNMKRFYIYLIALVAIFCLSSCKMSFGSEYSKEGVDEFCDTFGEPEGDGLLKGIVYSRDKCYNVTPKKVSEETDFRIFKFSHACDSFLVFENELYPMPTFGGWGFHNAVPCDFDNDGNKDLLIALSWGSGMHRSIITVFNSVTRKYTDIYDTSKDTSLTNFLPVDLIVSDDFTVYFVDVIINDRTNGENNLADLTVEVTGVAGYVSVEDGEIVFKKGE